MISEVKMSIGTHKNFDKLKINWEFVAAILCGVLIALGWGLEKMNLHTTSVVAYLLSFIIGGYAKAKEGLLSTIQTRQLNVEFLMIFAAIGSTIIGYWAEGAILIFIFSLSGALEAYTINKSKQEISSLMKLQPEQALLIQNGTETFVHVNELKIGDHILIKPGERVPADGKIVKGASHIDESALTGESIPVYKSTNDCVFAGTVNGESSITIEVTKEANDTLFQKIIELVQSAQSEKSPSQLFIEKFEGTYVKIVLTAVIIMMFLPHFLFGWSWNETFYRAMILLVVASPCALVASIMPATLSAISKGARHGILFKGGVHLENLAFLKAIAFDKTGTLTKGKPIVTDFYVKEGLKAEDMLIQVASIENHSNHPLAQAIVKYAKEQGIHSFKPIDSVCNKVGWGVTASIGEEEWKIGKEGFVGKKEAETFRSEMGKQLSLEGKTIIFVKKCREIVAAIAFKDVVRDEAKKAIQKLKEKGIYTIMLTGDSETTAKIIAKEIGVHEYTYECLPETKVEKLKKLREKYGQIAMVGDGINDAPALATANVGIAMGEGSDVAMETADIVLIKNDLPRIYEAILLSKRMNRVIKQNIAFSVGIIILLIISNFLQLVDLPIGVIGHEGSTLLVILNGLRLLK